MNDGLKQLQEEGVKWVDANKSKRFSGVTKLLTDLYPDNAHFIYELLQNAEDARDKTRPNSCGASVVRFTLNTNSLEFEHDGEGLFNLANVESITGIGDSNKSDDPTSIGKFGVGFKAVFAYTNTPEIHSGNYHFRIRDLVVPEPVETCQMGERATKFIFPFNHSKKSAAKAEAEITKGLSELGDNTLLFLKHIQKIEFLLPDGSLGHQERIEHDNGRIEIHTLRPDGVKRVSHWLCFEKTVNVADEEGKEKDCRIAIAYSLMNFTKEGEQPAWKVTPLECGQVSIFFPAKKEASNLRFHIHAPFASSVARDSVRECEANRTLIQAIAELTANSLERLRDLDSLNLASYSALPIKEENFQPNEKGEPHLFRPLYDRLREALKTQPLLPADDGGFIKADEAKLARDKELVELFSPEQLGSLFGKERLAWLDATITKSGETADLHTYLVGRKKNQWAKEWEQEPLIENIEVEARNVASKLTADFFQGQDEQWLSKFYAYLGKNFIAFQDRPFVRLENDQHVSPGTVEKPTAYLPPANASTIDQAIFPLVKQSLVSNPEVSKFLRQTVHLREPDKIDVVIRCLLPKFCAEIVTFERDGYVHDLKEIAAAYSSVNPSDATRLVDKLKETKFVAAVPASNPQGGMVWVKPGDSSLYRQSPELERWFAGNATDIAWFPISVVGENLPDDLKSKLGFTNAALIKRSPPNRYRKSEGGFDSDADIVGIQYALRNITFDRAKFIWGKLLDDIPLIKGKELISKTLAFTLDRTREVNTSKLGRQCIENAWLPVGGEYCKPSDVLLSELPDEFKQHSLADALSRALGMKQPVDMSPIAAAFGITTEEAERRMSVTPEEMKEIEQRRQEKSSSPTLPNKTSPNPERREKKIEEEARNTPTKTTEIRPRFVNPDYPEAQGDAKTYLEHQYTNDDGVMFCQICQAPQPVMLNDEPHFEAVTCIGNINAHHKQNNLALCPNHAAMYKNGGLIPDTLQRTILECESQKISLNLAGNAVELYFTQQHLGDLRAVLRTLYPDEI